MSDLFGGRPQPRPAAPMPEITIVEQIAEVKREIAMRGRVYGYRVKERKMTQLQADKQIAVMCAVLKTLEDLARCGVLS